MKAVTGFFSNAAGKLKDATKGAGNIKGRRVFNSFNSGDYESMTRLASTMTPK